MQAEFLRGLSSAGGNPRGMKVMRGLVRSDQGWLRGHAPALGQQLLAALSLAFCAYSCILGYRLSRYLYRESFWQGNRLNA